MNRKELLCNLSTLQELKQLHEAVKDLAADGGSVGSIELVVYDNNNDQISYNNIDGLLSIKFILNALLDLEEKINANVPADDTDA